jgi:S-adenosylmethionine decarboxylase proenzyme
MPIAPSKHKLRTEELYCYHSTSPDMTIGTGCPTRSNFEDKDNGRVTEALYFKKHFFFGTLLASCVAAFVVGRVARTWILDVNHKNILIDNDQNNAMQIMKSFEAVSSTTMILPDPVINYGKAVPRTMYTSKNFNTGSATTHSRWIVNDEEHVSASLDSPERTPTPAAVISKDPILGTHESDGEEHLPSGQHLLLDLENIDSHFLNSEQRLAAAMLKLVDQCGLTLLSYHCHKLHPNGVSCAGVLLESHVSFHTWPSRGVITIDLFTCGPMSLLPLVPVVENLFAIASKREKQKPKMVWAHKLRGFGGHADTAESTDMFYFPVGQMSDFKKEVGHFSFGGS